MAFTRRIQVSGASLQSRASAKETVDHRPTHLAKADNLLMMKDKWMRSMNTVSTKKDTKRLGFAYVATGPILMAFIRATKKEMRWNRLRDGRIYMYVHVAEG